MKRNRSE